MGPRPPPRSLAGQIAGGSSLPFAKSDVAIDTLPSASEIDRALAERCAQGAGDTASAINALLDEFELQ